MNRLYLTLFVLFLALYGLIEYFMQQQRSPDLQVELLQIDTADLSTIELFPPNQPNSLLLTQTDRGWVLSSGKLNVPARAIQVEQLLMALDSLETSTIVGSGNTAKRRLEWTDEEDILIRLRHYSGATESFHLFQPAASDTATADSLSAFIQLVGQGEVYGLTDFYPRQLPLSINAFRDRRIVRLDPDFSVAAILDQTQDTAYTYRPGQWPDSSTWARYRTAIQRVDGNEFADNLDELSLERKFQRRLLFRNNETDSLVITLYRDTLMPRPLILQSSQFPAHRVASDSTGVYQQFFGLFDSLRQLPNPQFNAPLPLPLPQIRSASDSLSTR